MPLSPPLCLEAYFQNTAVSGNDYTTVLTISPQTYTNGGSQAAYNGLNLAVGMYATSSLYGYVFRIKSISSQTSSSVTAVLEDIGGVNKRIDPSGGIDGGGPLSGRGYIFEINPDGIPALTAINNAPTITFPDSILGRFIYDKPLTLTETFTVAGGAGTHTLATSSDGITWTGRGSSIFTTACGAIAYNGSLWVAVGQGTNTVATSSDGINWTGRGTVAFTSFGTGVAWNGYLWVATGQGTNRIATSPDGVTWTGRGSAIITTTGNGVAWNGSIWVAVGQGTNTIATSLDGITWTGRGSTIFTTAGFGVAWNGSIWVAVGQGTNTIATSADGITWTGRGSTIITTAGRNVAWNGSIWVAVGEGTNTIATSPDGITWTGRGSTIITTSGRGVSWNGSLWIAVGQGTNTIATSTDGITWTGRGSTIITTVAIGVSSRIPLPFVGLQPANGVARRLTLLEAGSATGPSVYNSFSPTTGVYFPALDAVGVTTTGLERMRINNAGFVGIGTPDPRCRLQVVSAYTTATGPTNTTPSASTHLSVVNSVTQNSNGDSVLMEIGAQNRSAGSASTGVIYKYQAGFVNTNDTRGGNFVINAIPSDSPYTADGTALNRVNIRTDGNVGIGGIPGPSGPQGRLHVFAPSNPGTHGFLCVENGQTFGFGSGAGVGTNMTFKSNWQGDAFNPDIMGRIDVLKESSANYGDSYISLSNRYTTDRANGGVGALNERMRISAIGDVGIGTTAPTQRLDVAGRIRGLGNIVNTTTYSAYVNSWTAMAGASGWLILTLTFRPVQTSGNVTLVIHASAELAFNGGTGFDSLEWELRVNSNTIAGYKLLYNSSNIEGRGLGNNNFGAGTAVTTVATNTNHGIGLVALRGGDDALYSRNAYLVIHELSNAT